MLKCEKKNCTGCFACLNICPVHAICKKEDEFGFFYPVADDKKCIQCQTCNDVCPILDVKKNKAAENAIAAWINDKEIRQNSSSGGMFSALADIIFAGGGYVCGAVFDENSCLTHFITSDKKDLPRLRGSKYLQSDISGTYPKIEKLLKNKKQVLFVGTPCQVAGIKSYLKKEYDNLLTVDLICHGVVSQAVFHKYLNQIIGEGATVNKISFRDKSRGWKRLTTIIEYSKDGNHYFYKKESDKDPYMKAFLDNLALREACSNCKFAIVERCSDITLADFWGVASHDLKLDDDTGTSLVLLNTTKGETFFNNLENVISQKVPLNVAIRGNLTLSKPWSAHSNRNKFLKELFSNSNKSFSQIVDDNLSNVDDVAIFNFCSSNNYGALLTTYALYNLLKDKGLTTKVVHYVPTWHPQWFGSVFHFFALKYMDLSPCCRSRNDLKKLNPLFSTFIMGSDQVFRPRYVKYAHDAYFLGWTPADKKRIAYSVSFGVNYWEAGNDDNYTKMVKACLKCFDAISVREKSGVDICKNVFDIEVPHVLDPVFLFKEWEDLIKKASANKKFDLALNILDDDENISKAIADLKKERGLTSVNILDGLTPENWLWHIKNCGFVVTDSFHGVCFAIIFQKQFICVLNKARGVERIRSILEVFGFEERMIDILELDKLNTLYEMEIDYSQYFKKYEELKQISFAFLEKSFSKKRSGEEINSGIKARDELINFVLEKNAKKI